MPAATSMTAASAYDDRAPLPADLADIVLQLAAAESQAAALLRDLGDEQINWRPSAAAWSIAQCIDHLSTASRIQLAAMREAAVVARRRGSWRRGPITPGAPSRWFIRNLEPPPRQRLRAPAKIVPAATARSVAEAGGELARQQARIRELLSEVADLDLNRARYINPFVPLVRFTLGTGFLVLAAHQRRHLWQAGRVRQHPAFP